MSILNLVKKHIKDAAKKFKVEPYNVTSAQFWTFASASFAEWEIRKLGGFTGLRDTMFPSSKASKLQPRAKAKKFKLAVKKLVNFEVHEASIDEMFKLAKLSKDGIFKLVVQPDTHVPEEDKAAVNAFCQFLEYYKPHGIVNLGDFLECDAVSHWDNPSLKARRFVPQVKAGKSLLDRIGKAAGPQCVFKRFIVGNHEDWLNQYLTARIPELLEGLDDLGQNLSIESLLGLKELGYRSIPLNEILKVGKAHFIHGYYAGNNHAKKHLDVFGVNLYYGHLHDTASYSGVSVNGTHEAMSMGCLRSMNASFLKGKPNNWSHAFGIFEFRSDGSYTRYVPIIINGKLSYNGKIFNGKL